MTGFDFGVGVFTGAALTSLDDAVTFARDAADDGFEAVWFPQTTALDTLTVLAVVAREVPAVHLGSAVVPIQGRHPIPLGLQALTVAEAAGPGRFTLGLGVTHQLVSEGWFGIPYRGIVDVCAEVLDGVGGLLSPQRTADVDGSHVTAHLTTPMGVEAPSMVLAGLGPRMVELAGRATDGTLTWMTGARALAGRIVPALKAAAEAAGRPEPRVIVGIPVCVTEDPRGARERLAPVMERVAMMPSYRRQVGEEEVDDPVDLVVMGDEAAVSEQLAELAAAGMTEVCANLVGNPDEVAATRAFLTAR